jgi:hypothetical protein
MQPTLNYKSATIFIDGTTNLAHALAIAPLAIRVGAFTFPSASYLAGIWLSTTILNPTPVFAGIHVGSLQGALSSGQEYITTDGAQNLWHHHISRNATTATKSTGIGWELQEMPYFGQGDFIKLWQSNGNDANVHIDVICSIIYLQSPLPFDQFTADQPAMPRAQLNHPTAWGGLSSES